MALPLARQRFVQLLPHLSPATLVKAALYIAQEAEPQLEVEPYLQTFATMADHVSDRLTTARYPLRVIQTLNTYLFEEWGFSGNQQDYYDPRNSFLNQVLERRTGIPITLSLVYLEVARRIDFPMVGINFPGHFLIRPDIAEMALYVDPFAQGEILFEQDCQAKLTQMYGHAVSLKAHFFQPVTPTQLLIRMLTNLKHIYLHSGKLNDCVSVSERLLMLKPDDIQEKRDRGILYYQLGRWEDACQDLTDYLAMAAPTTDQPLINQLLKRMGKGV